MDALSHLIALASAGAALDLRVARLVAWFKRRDLRGFGYTSYRAFAADHVDASDAWLRQLVRLVESPLERVKAAVCIGLLPLRVAVRAPAEATVEDEEVWLADAVGGVRGSGRRERPAPEQDVSGPVLGTIQAARDLARIHLGADGEDAAADRYILGQWRRGDPAATRMEGLSPPPRPTPLPPWCHRDDPATALLGPWREPESIHEGLEQLRVAVEKRRSRCLDLGACYLHIVRGRLWAEFFPSVGAMARSCRVDLRTVQRAAHLVAALESLPDTVVALASGEISMDEARRIASIATAESEEDWLRTVPWYSAPDFARLVDLARRGVPVLPIADEVVDRLLDTLGVQDRVSFTGLQRQMPPPRHAGVHPDLPAAAAWFLTHARPDRHTGCGRVKQRDGWRCRNPECRRPTLRLHAHHEVFRSHGGSDASTNLLGLCPSCHLRGAHGGAFTVQSEGPLRIWTYSGGRRVVELTQPCAPYATC